MAEEIENRLKSLEAGFHIVATDLVGKIEENTLVAHQVNRHTQEHTTILKEHTEMLYEQGAILKEHGRDIREMKRDMTASFQQVAAQFAHVDERIDRIESRLDGMATKQDVSRIEQTLADILAGNTQQSEIMLQVLAKMSERGE